jgi:hypothetical protein
MKKLDFKMPSVQLSQLSSIVKPKSEPVFNRPMRTERPYQVSRTIYITLLSLMTALAMATIGLKAMTLIFIEDNTNTGFAFETGDPTPTTLAALPLNLYHAPAKLAIVAGVTAMCIGLAHGGLVLVDWKHGKRVSQSIPPLCSTASRRDGKLTTHYRHNPMPSAAIPCSCTSPTRSSSSSLWSVSS